MRLPSRDFIGELEQILLFGELLLFEEAVVEVEHFSDVSLHCEGGSPPHNILP